MFSFTALLLIKNQEQISISFCLEVKLVFLDQSGAFDTISCLSSCHTDHSEFIKNGYFLPEADKFLFGIPKVLFMLFSLYTTHIIKVIGNHAEIRFHFYTDDIQLYVHLTPKNAAQAFDMLKGVLQWGQK